jgi:hypothetical protein
MSDVLIIEFDGVGENDYHAVNKQLGIDEDGEGSWPSPLRSHIAATSDSGLVVFEVWDSKEAQAAFMAQLGPALGAAGVPQPTRTEWLTQVGQHIA